MGDDEMYSQLWMYSGKGYVLTDLVVPLLVWLDLDVQRF